MAHTDPTDLTGFARLALNLTGFLWLTQIPQISQDLHAWR